MTQNSKPANLVTTRQIAILLQMIFYAFLEIRAQAERGETERPRILAQTFRYLPFSLFAEDFDVAALRQSLLDYQEAFGDSVGFVSMLDNAMEVLPETDR